MALRCRGLLFSRGGIMNKHLCVLAMPRSGSTAIVHDVLVPILRENTARKLGTNLGEYFDQRHRFQTNGRVITYRDMDVDGDLFEEKMAALETVSDLHVLRVFPLHLVLTYRGEAASIDLARERMQRITASCEMIVLRRRDMLAQIASNAACLASNEWHDYGDRSVPAPAAPLSVSKYDVASWFWQNVVVFETLAAMIERPLAEVVYEDVEHDLAHVATMIGSPRPFGIEKMFRKSAHDWVGHLGNASEVADWIAEFRQMHAEGKSISARRYR